MSELHYLKCSCSRCGEHIEFPESAALAVINCPHCGQPTQLRTESSNTPPATGPATSVPRQTEPPVPQRVAILLVVATVAVVVLILAAGGLLLFKHTRSAPPPPAPAEVAPVQAQPAKASGPDETTPSPAPTPSPSDARRPKSLDDFKFGAVKLDKTKGSSLVYAVGAITNDSEYQRFGVRVKVDILNRNGGNTGSAQDYKDVIEPHKIWQFRALVIGGKAASAKVDGVTEEQ